MRAHKHSKPNHRWLHGLLMGEHRVVHAFAGMKRLATSYVHTPGKVCFYLVEINAFAGGVAQRMGDRVQRHH